MAATDIAGHGGAFAGPAGMDFNAIEWTGTLQIDEIAIPPAFGERWEGAELGAGRFRGSLRGKGQYNTASTAPFAIATAATDWSAFKGTCTLTSITGCTLVGTMIFSEISLRRAHGGYLEITANFRNATTDLLVTWDET